MIIHTLSITKYGAKIKVSIYDPKILVAQSLIIYMFVNFGHFREELKEKYEGKITQEMDGPIYEIVSRLMKAVVGRRITVPGTFKR